MFFCAHPGILRVLFVNEAQVNFRNAKGHTASHFLSEDYSRARRSVLHYARSARIARLIVEQCRDQDEHLLATCYEMMVAKDADGYTPLELVRRFQLKEVIEGLEAFTNLALETSTTADAVAPTVMLNPKLDDFQRAIASDCLNLLRTCIKSFLDSVLYMVPGYLTYETMVLPE